MGRRRVPLPPERMRPFRRSISIRPAELAVVPGRPVGLGELQRHALGRLLRGHLEELVRVDARARIAGRELGAEAGDGVPVAVDPGLGLQHHPAELVVVVAGLDLERGPRVALEVADLLGLRVGPGPDRAFARHVPERHEVRPAVAAERRAGDHALLGEEGGDLVVAHADLVPAAHGAGRLTCRAVRPPTPDDLDAVFSVVAAQDVADFGEVEFAPGELRDEWSRPGFDLSTDAVVVEAEGRVAAAAWMRKRQAFVSVDPAFTG